VTPSQQSSFASTANAIVTSAVAHICSHRHRNKFTFTISTSAMNCRLSTRRCESAPCAPVDWFC